jgi:predicted ATPase/DNA-binding CsgD family transcriptional regulator
MRSSLRKIAAGAHHPKYVFGHVSTAWNGAADRAHRSTKIRPHLPQEPNSFVGRERELGKLRGLVPATRLLTLTGPGGIGKTRLALRLLAAVAADFPDGTSLVELASLSHADMVVPRVAAAVGVTEEQGRPLIDTLADALRGRRMLLALDTCEHLIDAVAQLGQQLLATSPQLRIVATSREPLRVAGESVWPVPPLSVTPLPDTPPEAVRLFADRAQAALPGFTVTAQNARAITELCRAVDGIPLAIELAAARVPVLSVEQIRARLGDRFGLLTSGGRTAPGRQRTLRAAIDWSHDLLTGPEQVLLRRLAVFQGWSLEMAEEVCAGDGIRAADTLDLLAALVDKSLVVREPEALGQARYRLLDTIREYAAGKLSEAAEEPEFRRRHRDYVRAVLEHNFRVGMAIVPGTWAQRVDTFRRYDVDESNLWQAIGQCLADGDLAAGMRMCVAARAVWLARGEYRLGSKWLEDFLSAPGAARVPRQVRGSALIGYAQLLLSSDPAAAEPLARSGLEAVRAAGDDYWTTTALNVLSEIAVHTGRTDDAEALATQAMAIARSTGDQWGEGYSLGILAAVAGLRLRAEEARELANASIAIMRSLDHAWGAARAQLGLGDLAVIQGEHDDARERYTEALAILREVDARPEIARCLVGLARVAISLGEPGVARQHLTESIQLCRRTGNRIGVARGLEAFAGLAIVEGDTERAVTLVAAAAALREASSLPPLPAARAERYLAPARQLGDHVVSRLWNRGRGLSAETAIELAIKPMSPAPSLARAASPGAVSPGAVPASAVTPAAGGKGLLSIRELEIAVLVSRGHSNKDIAAELYISPATVARHIANIMKKLGFHSRTQIAMWTTDN